MSAALEEILWTVRLKDRDTWGSLIETFTGVYVEDRAYRDEFVTEIRDRSGKLLKRLYRSRTEFRRRALSFQAESVNIERTRGKIHPDVYGVELIPWFGQALEEWFSRERDSA